MGDLYLWECQGERFFLGGGPQQVTCNKNKNYISGSKAQYMIQKQRLLHCDAGNHRNMLSCSRSAMATFTSTWYNSLGRTSGTITVTKCNTIAWEGLVGRVTVTKYKTGFKLVKE